MKRPNDNLKDKIEHLLLFSSNKLLSYLFITSKIAKIITLLLSILSVQAFVYQIGFEYSENTRLLISHFYRMAIEYFTILLSIIILANLFTRGRERVKLPYLVLYIMLLGSFLPLIDKSVYSNGVPIVWQILSSETYRIIVLLLLSVLNISSSLIGLLGRKTSPPLILLISFAFIIMVGTGLLLLPNSTVENISIIDALFVSTSAVCVTGLTPFEISEVFTPMGQYIILFLIQIGGLGLMTLTSFFTLFFMGNTSLYNQIVVSDIISSGSVNSLLSTLLKILGVTALIEILGSLIIWFTTHGELGMTVWQEVKFSIFHSISAFCNAGFSTLPGNLSNPLLEGNSSFFTTISFLIIFGGLGFPIIINFAKTTYNKTMNSWYKISRRHARPRNMLVYNINTKLVITTTLALLVGGTILIAIFEWDRAFAGMNLSDKITHAFFAATSPRTAGFYTLDVTSFSTQTYLLVLFLMWIGGGSQSTAGGIKVSTFAISLMQAFSLARGKDRLDMMGRQISNDSISRANTTIFASILILIIAVMTLSIIEPHIPLQNLLYECISALGTVGLSMNTTPLLSDDGKIIVLLLMYIGRIGIVTLLLGIVRQSKNNKFNYPTDDIIIT